MRRDRTWQASATATLTAPDVSIPSVRLAMSLPALFRAKTSLAQINANAHELFTRITLAHKRHAEAALLIRVIRVIIERPTLQAFFAMELNDRI